MMFCKITEVGRNFFFFFRRTGDLANLEEVMPKALRLQIFKFLNHDRGF
jgi:hypothetical protein